MTATDSPTRSLVLIVEDERAIADNVFLALEAHGLDADVATGVKQAKALLDKQPYDAVVLDIGLPDGNGYALLEFIRQQRQLALPVLLLTARAALESKLQAFRLGADDYLTKPFALEELLYRIKSLIRRSKVLSEVAHKLSHGPIVFETATRRTWVDGAEVKLTRISQLILELLMRYGGRPVSREQLEERIWQGEPPSLEALRSQLHLLRRALKTGTIDWIETVPAAGWRMRAEPAAATSRDALR